MSFDLIIWDCDGCLVDSEMLSCGSAAALLTASGYLITTEQFIDRFAGWRWPDIYRVLENETNKRFEIIVTPEQIAAARREAFERGLKPTPYVVEILDSIGPPACIASGSETERLEHALKLTDLWGRFENKIFSAHDVVRGKPAPDVFLYAAEKMGAKPGRCLVIEDSGYGVKAAKAAGMTVFAYFGGSHVSNAWREKVNAEKPDAAFDDMRELPELVRKFSPNSCKSFSG